MNRQRELIHVRDQDLKIVRNAADGAVEMHVAGRAEAVATLERRLAMGPGGARVHGVALHRSGDRTA